MHFPCYQNCATHIQLQVTAHATRVASLLFALASRTTAARILSVLCELRVGLRSVIEGWQNVHIAAPLVMRNLAKQISDRKLYCELFLSPPDSLYICRSAHLNQQQKLRILTLLLKTQSNVWTSCKSFAKAFWHASLHFCNHQPSNKYSQSYY